MRIFVFSSLTESSTDSPPLCLAKARRAVVLRLLRLLGRTESAIEAQSVDQLAAALDVPVSSLLRGGNPGFDQKDHDDSER